MRSIIHNGDDDWPPKEGEGALHICPNPSLPRKNEMIMSLPFVKVNEKG